jgi:hypothetical protein
MIAMIAMRERRSNPKTVNRAMSADLSAMCANGWGKLFSIIVIITIILRSPLHKKAAAELTKIPNPMI